MLITKITKRAYWALVFLVFLVLVLVLIFSTVFKKRFIPIASNVVGQTTVTEAEETLYFTRSDSAIMAHKHSKSGKIQTLFTLSGNYSFISASWSPNYSQVAVALNDLSVISVDGFPNKKFIVMDVNKEDKIYTSNNFPGSYIMADQNEILGYFSDPEDWTKPGIFKKIVISPKINETDITPYETSETLLLYKDGVDLIFADIDQDSGEGFRSIKKLNIDTKKITEISRVGGLIDAKYIGNRRILLTRLVNNKPSVYLKDLNKKEDVLISINNYNERISFYKDRAIGFIARGYTFGEQREGSEKNTSNKDFLGFIDSPEKDILNKNTLADCYSPNIGSHYSASFICGHTLYKAKGKLF